MVKRKIVEILCLSALALFIAFTVNESRGTDKSAQQIAQELLNTGLFNEIHQRNATDLQSAFLLGEEDFSSVSYYRSDDLMNVDELLIIRLKDGEAAANTVTELEKNVSEYASSRFHIFDGYGDEQAKKLSSYIFRRKGNCVLFAVCTDTAALADAFDSVL